MEYNKQKMHVFQPSSILHLLVFQTLVFSNQVLVKKEKKWA